MCSFVLSRSALQQGLVFPLFFTRKDSSLRSSPPLPWLSPPPPWLHLSTPFYSAHYGQNDLLRTENLILFLRGSKPFNSFHCIFRQSSESSTSPWPYSWPPSFPWNPSCPAWAHVGLLALWSPSQGHLLIDMLFSPLRHHPLILQVSVQTSPSQESLRCPSQTRLSLCFPSSLYLAFEVRLTRVISFFAYYFLRCVLPLNCMFHEDKDPVCPVHGCYSCSQHMPGTKNDFHHRYWMNEY